MQPVTLEDYRSSDVARVSAESMKLGLQNAPAPENSITLKLWTLAASFDIFRVASGEACYCQWTVFFGDFMKWREREAWMEK